MCVLCVCALCACVFLDFFRCVLLYVISVCLCV